MRLAEMVTRRKQLVDLRAAEKNRMHHHLTPLIRKQAEKTLEFFNKQIAELKRLIAKEIAADEDLKRKFERIKQVSGVGIIVAATMLALMPELGTLTRNEAAALIGVAPFVCDSGKFKGKRRIWGGRADPRAALYMAALTAVRKNPIHKAIFDKLRAANKPFKVAIIAIVRKLVMLLNHLLANPDFSLAC